MYRPLVYISGPYSIGPKQVHVDSASNVGLTLAASGFTPIIPHLMHYIKGIEDTLGYDRCLDICLSMVPYANALFRLPGMSKGADKEVELAESLDIPVYFDLEKLIGDRNILASNAKFHEELVKLGKLHDRKRRDYGTSDDPFANIRSSADMGIEPWKGAFLRLNDKVHRIISYMRNGHLANEGVEDSLRDIAVYSIIAMILHRERNNTLPGG